MVTAHGRRKATLRAPWQDPAVFLALMLCEHLQGQIFTTANVFVAFYSVRKQLFVGANLKYVALGKPLSPSHVSGWQRTNSSHSKSFPQLCHFSHPSPLFHPQSHPCFCHLFWTVLVMQLHATSSFFLPPLLPRWQLSLRIAKILHLWQLCFFMALQPLIRFHRRIYCDESQKERAELFFVLYLLPSCSSQI